MQVKHSPSRLAASLLAAIVFGVAARAQETQPRPRDVAKPSGQQKAGEPQSAKRAREAPEIDRQLLDPGTMDTTRGSFIELLKRHPRVRMSVYLDPSLLANQEYLTNKAPDLWDFLQNHPEIAREPDFFLGADVQGLAEARDLGSRFPLMLARVGGSDNGAMRRILDDLWPFLVFVIIVAALLWVLRVILENRRWSRIAKVQADVHTKLLEKFASNQELLAYMETEAGKRFLESAPIPIELEQRPRLSAPFGRILWSVQLGFILGLMGLGLLYVRNRVPEGEEPLLVFGTLGLMLGVGFIVSAGVSYVLSKHMGLLPSPHAVADGSSSAGKGRLTLGS